MSAFLDPIHYWLYNKIELQDKMTDAVLALNEKKGYVADLNQTVKENVILLKKGHWKR